jgi:hypothetical protein
MRKMLTLLAFLIIGFLAGYSIINYLVIQISYTQYLIIEIVITVSHLLYNLGKQEILKSTKK